jgi:hypothetical protein
MQDARLFDPNGYGHCGASIQNLSISVLGPVRPPICPANSELLFPAPSGPARAPPAAGYFLIRTV